MIVGVPRELFPGERRVALVPQVLPALEKIGATLLLEAGAGSAAGYPDSAYQEKGGRLAATRSEVFAEADILVQVLSCGADPVSGMKDLPLYRKEQVVIAFLRALGDPESLARLAPTGVAAFAIEMMPRITRAQSMDALSSMATVAGYKAVLLAADALAKMFPMMMTAAGTISPAKVLILGVGVAGLQAIATARKLGAVVSAYDIRPAVKEQVQSLGARFVELPLETQNAEDSGGYARAQDEAFYRKQRELLAKAIAESDVVITTANVPGRKAPILVTDDMVRGMEPGAVIVDLAAERGGNCELTEAGVTVEAHGVRILGPVNIASLVPFHASQMYANNITAFLRHLVKEGKLAFDLQDEITRETLVVRGGEIVHPRVLEALSPGSH